MSSSVAEKSQDHYAVLGIDPKADLQAIRQAYSRLEEKYHPHNPTTGDAVRFDAIGLAFEVLSDTTLRRGFDQVKGVNQEEGGPRFSGLDFFNALGREAMLRLVILCILYDRRRVKPGAPSFSMRNLESMVNATGDEMISVLWYLKQRRLVVNDDKSNLLITVEGVDFLEASRPVPESVMALLTPAAMTGQAHAQLPQPVAAGREPVLAVLNRALSRL